MIDSLIVSKSIAVPAEMAWMAIAQIDGLDHWFPVITHCRLIGAGVGATRILTLASGEEITDTIELIDHGLRRFQYKRIQSPFPVTHYLGTVDVHQSADGCTEIAWTVEIDVPDDKRDQLAAFLKQALAEGIDGLEQSLMSSMAPASA